MFKGLLDPRCVDGLHGLVDFKKGATTWNRKKVSVDVQQMLVTEFLDVTLTSLGLKVGNAVQDDVMKEQRLVIDLNVAGQQAAEVLHIPVRAETVTELPLEELDHIGPPELNNMNL